MTGSIVKLELEGRFDAYQAHEKKQWLKAEIEKMHANGVPVRLIVDMHQVSFIDSAGLAALVVGIKKAQEYGGSIHLFGMPKAVQLIFELSWLDKAFPIFDTEAEATAAFDQPA